MKINLLRIVILYMLVLSCMKAPINNHQGTSLVIQSNEQLKEALFDAITQNNTQQVQQLLESVSAEDGKELLASCNQDGRTPLMQAVEEGKVALAKILVSKANSADPQILISWLESAEQRHEMGIIATILENLDAAALSALLLSLVQQDKEALLPYLFTPENKEKLSVLSIKQAWVQAVSQEKVPIVTVLVKYAQTTLAHPTIATALQGLPESPLKEQVTAAMHPLEEVKEQLPDVTAAPAPQQTQLAEETPDATLDWGQAIEEKKFERVSKEALQQRWEQAIREKKYSLVKAILANEQASKQLGKTTIEATFTQAIRENEDELLALLLEKSKEQLQIEFIVGQLAQAIEEANFLIIPHILRHLGKAQVINVLLTADTQKEDAIIPSLLVQAAKDNLWNEAFAQAIAKKKLVLVGRMLDRWVDQLANGVLQESFKAACQQGNSDLIKLFLEREKVKEQLQDVTPWCFTQAINQDQDTIVGYFLEHAKGSLSEDILVTALIEAIEGGKEAVQKILLAQVSEAVIQDVWKGGIDKKSCAVLEALLTHCAARSKLGQPTIDAGFITACGDEEYRPLLKILLSRGNIQEEVLLAGLSAANQAGDVRIVGAIFEELEKEKLARVLLAAVEQGEHSLIKTILTLPNQKKLVQRVIVAVFNQAVTQDQDTIVGYFLEHAKGSLSEDILVTTLIEAIEGGKEAVKESLLAQVSEAVIQGVWKWGIDKKSCAVLEALLTHCAARSKLGQPTIDEGFITACGDEEHMPLLKILLSKENIQEEVLLAGLSAANQAGDVRIVGAIFEELEKEKLARVLLAAVEQGEHSLIKTILTLPNQKKLAQHVIVAGFNQAVTQDQDTIVGYFLEHAKGSLSEDTLATALLQAIEGEQEAVKALLFAQVSEEVIQDVWKGGIDKKSCAVLEALLTHCAARSKLGQPTIDAGFITACGDEEYRPLLKILLSRGNIQEEVLLAGLSAANQAGDVRIVGAIFEELEKEKLARVLLAAVEQGEHSLIKTILTLPNQKKLAQRVIVAGFNQAVTQDQDTIVGYFLEHAEGSLSEDILVTTLIEAIEGGKEAVQKILLAQVSEAVIQGVWKGGIDKKSCAVLEALLTHCAARSKLDLTTDESNFVKLLFEKMALGELGDKNFLYWAAKKDYTKLVKILLEIGEDMEVSDNWWGETPLHRAASQGDEGIVELLLEKGANTEVKNKYGATPLHKAAKKGDEGIVELLLEKGTNTEVSDNWGETSLHVAVERGVTEVVKLLLEKGADMEVRNKYGTTPLHKAVRKGDEGIVELLLEKGADMEVSDEEGNTPLHETVAKGVTEVVKLLLEKGADTEVRNKYGDTPLQLAVRKGDEGIVELLLEKGAKMEVRDSYDHTPLHVAVARGVTEVVKILLEKGADMEVRNKDGATPLHWAGHKASVELLLEKGAKMEVSDKKGRTPLHWAVERGVTEVVKILLEKGAKMEVRDKYGQTPLREAVRKGDEGIVELLSEKGAKMEVSDEEGQTPLYEAVRKGDEGIVELLSEKGAKMEVFVVKNRRDYPFLQRVELVKLLLEKGAKMEINVNQGQTPLHAAAAAGHTASIALLLEKGAKMEINDNQGQTPLHRAAAEGHTASVEVLLEKGANMEVRNKDGQTPLHAAAAEGHTAIVEVLLEKGAKMEVRNKDGQTPLREAVREGHTAIVELLLEKGAKMEINVNQGQTPLHAAAEGHTASVEVLLEKGANMEVRNKDGQTPLHRAAAEGHTASVEVLLEKGANMEVSDNGGNTPLHFAAANGHKASVELLLEKGAKMEVSDKVGHTPLYWAAVNGHKAIVKLLLEKG